MDLPSLGVRIALANKLRNRKQDIAETVTREFYERHPDWVARFGPSGPTRGIEDACFHVEFLAGAIESGDITAFPSYVQWTQQVLRTRGIQPHFVTENLEQIQAYLAGMLDPAEWNLVAPFLQAGCSVVPDDAVEETGAEPKIGLRLTQEMFTQALLQGQRTAAWNIVWEAYRQGHPIVDLYVDVIQASLYTVGRLWQINQITVAEEHVATAIAQYVLAQLYPHLALPTTARGSAVITGVEGELHQVGANMVADILEADGWTVHFLGTNLPHAGILKLIEDRKPNAVGISVTMLVNLPRVRMLISDIRAKFPRATPRIFVGGAAFRAAPNLPREIGADGFAPDLRTATTLFRSSPDPPTPNGGLLP